MYAQTHIHVPRNKLIVAWFCILMNLIFTYLISWISQLCEQRRLRRACAPTENASALSAHKHTEEMHALALNLKSVKPLRWWGHLGIRFVYHTRCMYPDFVTCEDQSAHRTALSAPLFLEQNIKHFVGPDLGPTVC